MTAVRPPPIRTDASNRFAHYSMEVRVPKILDDVLAQNSDLPMACRDAVGKLRDEIRESALLPPLGFPAPDEAEWQSLAKAARWLETDWFPAENYVYRALMSAVRYWERGRDPFAPVKHEELASPALWQGIESTLVLPRARADETIYALLELALWGNRVDLSYGVGTAFGRAGKQHDLLCDDRDRATAELLRPNGDVHLVADNTGSELSMDLALADALHTLVNARVTLHVKMHPVFVSDATVQDVWSLVSAMQERGGETQKLAHRLRARFDEGRLRVVPDFFWNGPRFLWERPARIAAQLDGATMVIFKGDANYRRVVGDALFAPETSVAEATGYFPAPLLLVRTLKSDSVVGLPAGIAARLDAEDVDWRINAKRGVIQRGGSDTST